MMPHVLPDFSLCIVPSFSTELLDSQFSYSGVHETGNCCIAFFIFKFNVSQISVCFWEKFSIGFKYNFRLINENII